MEKELKTQEEFEEAFNKYQAQRMRAVAYSAIRRKAIRRTLSFLRRKYQSEYEAYLNRFTDELTKEWENRNKERK